MNGILDTVKLHEKKQSNGMWVKKIRFMVPLNAPDGNVFDEVELVGDNSLPKENHDEACFASEAYQRIMQKRIESVDARALIVDGGCDRLLDSAN